MCCCLDLGLQGGEGGEGEGEEGEGDDGLLLGGGVVEGIIEGRRRRRGLGAGEKTCVCEMGT